MSIYVANDLHGNPTLTNQVVNAIKKMAKGDALIINGNGAGARGPKMNKIVKIFYEVRRGETDFSELISALAEIVGGRPIIPKEWVFGSVHAGVFCKLAAEHYEKFDKCMENELHKVLEETLEPLSKVAAGKVRILYLPGNAEIVPSDFDVKEISVERTLPPEQRFYQRVAKEGYFDRFGIEYVPYIKYLHDERTMLLSTNLLDLSDRDAINILSHYSSLEPREIKTVVVHYPPVISPLGTVFDFWYPNQVDVSRAENLKRMLGVLQLDDAATIYFGHIHLGSDPRMDTYPPTMGFKGTYYDYVWVKPGAVIKI